MILSRILFALALTLWVGAGARDALDRWVQGTVLPDTLAETSVEIRDRHGTLLRAYPVADGLIRFRVTMAEVDPTYIDMLVAYEDKRFWRHSGVDPRAMLRALWQALMNGRTVSGGSTLTMQVARLLEDGPTGRWSGKLRQIRVALALEQRLDKRQILDLYLTHAPFGGPLEGIRAGSRAWFGKPPSRLTPAQAALLVALPQSPETRRPDRHPDRALAARNRVLARVAVTDADAAPVPTVMRPLPRLAPHLADVVRAANPGQSRHDLTIDAQTQSRMQRLATDAVRTAGPSLSIAIIAANHQTGDILASVGSPAYDETRHGFVDMTRALRSPGSTLKPLVYALAFDQGLAHPETLIHDGPLQIGRYAPRNFDGEYRGDLPIREALQLSLNIPVVKLTKDLGPAALMAALHRSGAKPELPGGKPGLAIALGGLGISLRDLVQTYAGLAAAGQSVPLRHDLHAPQHPQTRIISDVAAWHIADILRGLAPPPGAPKRVVAYKTGTSYGHRDAWAIGWDGQHLVGIWMGRPDGTPVPGAFGGDLAAPILFRAFGLIKPDFAPFAPPPPATLILTGADLPPPLKRYRPRGAALQTATNPPQLIFPPDGARLIAQDGLVLKLRGGTPPYSVLVNGQPAHTGLYRPTVDLDPPGTGFSTLVVIDAKGQSDRISIRID